MRPWMWIALAVVLLLVAGAATVFNKRWWVQRIQAKWVMSTWVYDEVVQRWMLDVQAYNPNNMGRYSLASLMKAYFKGEDGWHRVGTEPPPGPVAAPLGQGPLGVGIVTNNAA